MPKVCIVVSKDLLGKTDLFVKHRVRDRLAAQVPRVLGMTTLCAVTRPQPATLSDLAACHSPKYLSLLATASECASVHQRQADSAEPMEDAKLISLLATRGFRAEDVAEAGLGTDCPVFPGLWDYCCAVAGSSIRAAEVVGTGQCRVALSLVGGRHHALPSRASGFCYVNDCVLAIFKLQKLVRGDVLYVDVDAHHGDGVEEAVASHPRVHCFSVHRAGPGVFPGTAQSMSYCKPCSERGAVLNVPLGAGCRDHLFIVAVTLAVEHMVASCKPKGIVLQCGVDGLGVDPHRLWNLSHEAYRAVVEAVLRCGLPTVILGGGGYNPVAAASTWAHVLDVALGAPASTPHYVTTHLPECSHLVGSGFPRSCAVPALTGAIDSTIEEQTMSELQHLLSGYEAAHPRAPKRAREEEPEAPEAPAATARTQVQALVHSVSSRQRNSTSSLARRVVGKRLKGSPSSPSAAQGSDKFAFDLNDDDGDEAD
jgi:acetoin utilization deacetylase AcuC-like enzyme